MTMTTRAGKIAKSGQPREARYRRLTWATAFALAMGMVVQAATLIVDAIPLIRGQVAPNASYGFRTPKTMSNAAHWYAANAFSGRATIVACVVVIGLAIVLVVQTKDRRVGVLRVLLRGFIYDIVPLVLLVLTLLIYDWSSAP